MSEDELFSDSEIKYAFDHRDVNWNEQALGCLKEKIDQYPYSKKCIESELLESELFTESEVKYAFEHANIDWNEQALLAAKNEYLIDESISKEQLINELEEMGFTKEQSEKAANRIFNS
jgi:SOS response regulatory protein OraA/RecX